MAKITDTKGLREMLLEEIQEIRNGNSDKDRANSISKLTNQVISTTKLDLEFVKTRAKYSDKTKYPEIDTAASVPLGLEQKK